MPKQTYLCQRGAYNTNPSRTGYDPAHNLSMLLRIWRKLGIDQQQAYEMACIWQEKHEVDLNPVYLIDEVYTGQLDPLPCDDPVMERHCVGNKCGIFRMNPNALKVRSFKDMVDDLVYDVKEGTREIANFNSLFPNVNYPFMRGEVMVFVGAEKSGKTSFIHNWFLSMLHKPKILNVHLEMSNASEISRLIQVKKELQVNASSQKDGVKDLILNNETFEDVSSDYDFISFYAASRYIGDIKRVIDDGEYDIVYIDSFDCIQYKGQVLNEVSGQKELIAELQHFARTKNLLLIIVHHQNKHGDAHNIISNSISGLKEIAYQADHIIGLELAKQDDSMRRLKKIASRRHAELNYSLYGDANTLKWKLTADM